MPLKILNWNVEQFGLTRSSNSGRLFYVCQLIASVNPDVASVIEIKTLKPVDAITIAGRIVGMLQNKFNVTYNYILSYHNKLEMYLFLYNNNTVRPICLGGAARQVYTENNIINAAFSVQNGVNTTIDNNGYLDNHFPLIEYYNIQASRPPAIGFFRDVNAGTNFALFAWHNMAGNKNNDSRPVADLEDMSSSGYINNRYIDITINTVQVRIPSIILSGDFNVDYLKRAGTYQYFTNFSVAINTPTILVDYSQNSSYNKRADVVSACFDNFIWSGLNNRNVAGQLTDTISDCHKKTLARKMSSMLRGFSREDFMTELGLEFCEKYLKNKDAGYIPPKAIDPLITITLHYCFRTIKITKEFLDELYKYVSKYDVDRETFDEYINSLNEKINSLKKGLGRAQMIAAKSVDPDWGDALFLHHSLLSDHMPVVLTIN